jgi:hypothetical protein
MKYYFDQNLLVSSIIDNIKNGKIVKDEIILLINNFVKKDQILLEIENDSEIKSLTEFSGDIYFSEDKKKIYSSRQGFASILVKTIKIFPLYIISQDNMKLYLIVPKNINDIDFIDIEKEIKSLNLYNFDPSILNNYKKQGFYTIFKGKYPRDGRCQKIYLLVDDKVIPGMLDEFGNIDYFERRFLVPLNKDDVIAKVEEEIKPEDGYDIFGKTIVAKYDNKPAYLLGKNVSIKEGFVVSDIDGVLSIKENKINVFNFLKIKGDASILTGNIHSNASLIVDGNILENIEVETNGDLFVLGGVYSPKILKVDGNLFIRKGIIGKIDQLYEIKGDLYCQYIENCFIKVNGNIIVEREILMSNVFSNKSIIVTKKEGEILSSKVAFYDKLFVNNLGKEKGAKNEITFGYSFVVEKLLNELSQKEKELFNNKNKYSENEFNLKLNIINNNKHKLLSFLYNPKAKLFLFGKAFYDNVIFFYKGKFKNENIIEKKIFVMDVDLKLKMANFLEKVREQLKEYCEKFYKLGEQISKIESKEFETKYVSERKRKDTFKNN